MNNYIIREAIDRDMPQIISLLGSVNGDMANIMIEQLIVVIYNDSVVGCGRVISFNDFDEIASIAVDDNFRGQKIGSSIVQYLIDNVTQGRDILLGCDLDKELFYNKLNFTSLGYVPDDLQEKYDRYKPGIIMYYNP